ncbi:MAG: M36 family metallopeptidase [Gammaproteobacteria bacterium]|nr:M36 family metallopeptidase [Gammaproteobacteria bacterium]MDH5274069.1 M36 family metallopeptidase [Gammaproteobacteria bacterium]
MIFSTRRAALVAAIAAVLAGSSAYAQSTVGLDRSQARVASAAAGLPLTAASRAAPQSIVFGYLQSHGRGADVLASLRVTSSSVSTRGVTHLRMEQLVDGLVVHGAYARAAVNANGELVQLIDHLANVSLVQPSRIDASQAFAAAMMKLYPAQAATVRAAGVAGNTTTFAGGAFFYRNPTATAVVLSLDNGTLARGWLVETWTADKNQLHYTVVDGDGRVLDVESRTNTDSYNVFPEDPGKSGQTVVAGPGTGNAESPSGWLGGAQTTINIQGNNVRAYLDTDANNAADAGGTAVTNGNFSAVADLGQQPSVAVNKAVAAQNLFYLNNVLHDTLYRHGFNEANGNFQVNNFGNGGAGNDPVNAEAQDGSGTDNANMSTPSDGSSPRMQMYVWNSNPAGLVTVGAANYPAFPSSFGPALTTTGTSGALAATGTSATTDDACAALAAGSLANKVAVINRGTCNFTTKVLNAQNAGARAVIITNNDAAGAFSPGGTDRKVKIPSVMVTQADGNLLRGTLGAMALVKKITALQVDGDLDSDIVYHEYGHGLTWRMIGGMSGPLAGAIGEGASDVVAFLINGDDVVGEYAYNSPTGIRRARYAGYPYNYSYVGSGTGSYEVHNDGEIYAAAMWRVLELYQASGLTADQLMADFVDGMNYTPATPAFEKMRDGMLASIARLPDSDPTKAQRKCAVWTGFTEQGIGEGASGTVSRRGTVTVVESFSKPADACP